MPGEFLVKIQISLSDDGDTVLIYNKDRSFEAMLATTPEIRALFRGRPKIYAYVTRSGDELEFQREAPPQDW
jgi:hypothetical protein